MTLAALSKREAVLDALRECDQLGRAEFLEKYGFHEARSYWLVHEGRRYDSKAVVAAAHGFQFPEDGPLRSGEFSGGASTVQRKLESLGFEIEVDGDVAEHAEPASRRAADPWAEFIGWAKRFHMDPAFQAEEYDYKIDIAERLRSALGAVQRGDPGWHQELKRAFGGPNNLVDFRVRGPFLDWIVDREGEVAEVVAALGDTELDVEARLGRFLDWVPPEVVSGRGGRLSIVSTLLLAYEPTVWPVYRSTPVNKLFELLDLGPIGGDERAVYRRFVGVLDELIRRSAPLGLILSDRLDAQSVVWAVTSGRPLATWGKDMTNSYAAYLAGNDHSTLAQAVERFRASGRYSAADAAKAEGQRQKMEAMLTAEALDDARRQEVSRPIHWLVSQAYGFGGGASQRVSRALAAGHLDAMLLGIAELLHGDGPLDERLRQFIDPEVGPPGMGSAMAVKLLSITRPDEWIPSMPSQKDPTRKQELELLSIESPEPDGDLAEQLIAGNDRLRNLFEPHFGADLWAMREFIRFLWWERSNATETPSSVQELADQLRVPPDFVAEVLELLDDKRQVVFYGPPGTGKTFVALAIAEHLTDDSAIEIVQFHPSYSYEDFVEGFRPTESGAFRIVEGPLRRLAAAAIAEPDKPHVLIIDELNRGNVAKVFGELYFLLEYRDRSVTLQYSSEPLRLPPNLYLIATMNSADRSIGLIDAALRRRFHFVSFYPSDDHLRRVLPSWLAEHSPELAWLAPVLDRTNALLGDQHLAVGPSHFLKKDLTDKGARRIWTYSVLPYLQDQFFGREYELEKFDLDRLRREVAGETATLDAGERMGDETPTVAD
jgi:MoxR-like ATPase